VVEDLEAEVVVEHVLVRVHIVRLVCLGRGDLVPAGSRAQLSFGSDLGTRHQTLSGAAALHWACAPHLEPTTERIAEVVDLHLLLRSILVRERAHLPRTEQSALHSESSRRRAHGRMHLGERE
jgi:hypothetical protein